MKKAQVRDNLAEALGSLYGMLPEDRQPTDEQRMFTKTFVPKRGAVFGYNPKRGAVFGYNNQEFDAKVKAAISLYLRSWVIPPLEKALSEAAK